jgi:hypothetical protein
MEFQSQHLERLISSFRSFSVEGFNIFALGDDDLPHLICACPNKDFARAICAMLEIAKRAQDLKVLDAEITSHCHLVPKILADGSLAMAASLFDEVVWKDGDEVEYDKLDLQLGTPEYEDFVQQFLSEPFEY